MTSAPSARSQAPLGVDAPERAQPPELPLSPPPPPLPASAATDGTQCALGSHWFPAVQSALEPHAVRQAPLPHRYGEHEVFPPSGSTTALSGLQLVQAPALQVRPGAQSPSPPHRVLHLFVAGSHSRLSGHVCGEPAVHLPAPSHALSVSWPFVHVDPQLVPAAG
jgi:hypothetical protein